MLVLSRRTAWRQAQMLRLACLCAAGHGSRVTGILSEMDTAKVDEADKLRT